MPHGTVQYVHRQVPSGDEDGQGLAEYALILALIAIVAIIALIFLGGQVSTILSTSATRSSTGSFTHAETAGAPVADLSSRQLGQHGATPDRTAAFGPGGLRFPDATLFGPDGLTLRADHRYLDEPTDRVGGDLTKGGTSPYDIEHHRSHLVLPN